MAKNWDRWVAWRKGHASPFLFAKRPIDEHLFSAYMINVSEVVWRLEKHYLLFARELKIEFHPLEVALQFEDGCIAKQLGEETTIFISSLFAVSHGNLISSKNVRKQVPQRLYRGGKNAIVKTTVSSPNCYTPLKTVSPLFGNGSFPTPYFKEFSMDTGRETPFFSLFNMRRMRCLPLACFHEVVQVIQGDKNKGGSIEQIQLPAFRSYPVPLEDDPMITQYERERASIQKSLERKDFVQECLNRLCWCNP